MSNPGDQGLVDAMRTVGKMEAQQRQDTMTPEEKMLLISLAEVWNQLLKLPIEHPDDLTEVRHLIHALQEKVMARSVRRGLPSPLNDIPSILNSEA